MIEQKLKNLNLKRHGSVGKKMANNIWVHIHYVDQVIPLELYNKALLHMPDFQFSIVRYDSKLNTIALIECNDFDESPEPIVGRSLLIKPDGTVTLTKQPANPLIYHHKWMFVQDDYAGFDAQESKQRSLTWKSILGTDRVLSSKIGRLSFWQQWLIDNNISSIASNDIWKPAQQTMTSKNTSINKNKLPRIFSAIPKVHQWEPSSRNLDLGGGLFDNVTEHLREHRVTNLIYDVFNRSHEHNNAALQIVKSQGVQTVTISNVLNVIPENSVKAQLIQQAYEALLPGGTLFVTCYPGNGKGQAGPSGKDQWQEHQKLEYYIPIVQAYFKNVTQKHGMLYCKK